MKQEQQSVWDEDSEPGNRETDFLPSLKDGEEIDLQFTTTMKSFSQHWLNKKSYVCLEENCPLCQHPSDDVKKKSRRFLGVVIHRPSGNVKLFNFGIEIKGQLAKLNKNEKWGNPENLEVTVARTNNGRIGYSVTPYAKNPLNQDEKTRLAAFVARVDLNKFNMPEDYATLQALVPQNNRTITDTFATSAAPGPTRKPGLNQKNSNFDLNKEVGKI